MIMTVRRPPIVLPECGTSRRAPRRQRRALRIEHDAEVERVVGPGVAKALGIPGGDLVSGCLDVGVPGIDVDASAAGEADDFAATRVCGVRILEREPEEGQDSAERFDL